MLEEERRERQREGASRKQRGRARERKVELGREGQNMAVCPWLFFPRYSNISMTNMLGYCPNY
jgi:hypothetical protein